MAAVDSKKGTKIKRGVRLRYGAGWELRNKNGRGKRFPVTVLYSWNRGRERFAVISVRKLSGKKLDDIDFERTYTNEEIDKLSNPKRKRDSSSRAQWGK